MPAAPPLRAAAPDDAHDPPAPAAKEAAHLVLVTPARIAHDQQPATARRQTFGPRLKAARERSGVTLDAIAESTKVSASLLAALERGDVSRWPKGIFRRAFFRDYVVAIGLPAEPYVTEFLQLYPDGEEHPVAAAPAASPEAAALRLTLAPAPGLPRERLRAALLDFLLILMAAVAVAWWSGAGLLTTPAIVGLCYGVRAMDAARRHAPARRCRRARNYQSVG